MQLRLWHFLTRVNDEYNKKEKKEQKNKEHISRGEHTLQGQVYRKEIQIVDHVQPVIIESIQPQNNIRIYKIERSLIISVYKVNIISTIPPHIVQALAF